MDRWFDVDGNPCLESVPGARFVKRRRVKPGTPGAKKLKRKSTKWYGRIPGKSQPIPLSANKVAAQQMLAALVNKAELGKVGIHDPFEEHRKRPLKEHLADFRRELEARGNSPRYTEMVVTRLNDLVEGCGFGFVAEISASRVNDWLADQRRKGKIRIAIDQEEFTRNEAANTLGIKPASVNALVRRHRLPATGCGKARRFPRSTVEFIQDRICRGVSVETTNQYLTHLKSFCNWMVRDQRMGSNPVTHLEPGNIQVDRRHDRRELDTEELRRLLATAKNSGKTFRGLTGNDRYHLYATACGTGFRASALASLSPESFDLTGDLPTVTLAARHAKNRKTKIQPLPQDVADLMREFIADKIPGQPLWGGHGRVIELRQICFE